MQINTVPRYKSLPRNKSFGVSFWESDEEATESLRDYCDEDLDSCYPKKNFTTWVYYLPYSKDDKSNWHVVKWGKEVGNSKSKDNLLLVKLDKKAIAELPNELNDIFKVIEESKAILKLKKNWDFEGAESIKKDVWIRSIKLIAEYSKEIFEKKKLIIDSPDISPVADGSIDILWENENYQMLINIPHNLKKEAVYYQSNWKSRKHKGSFNTKEIDDILMTLLIKTNDKA